MQVLSAGSTPAAGLMTDGSNNGMPFSYGTASFGRLMELTEVVRVDETESISLNEVEGL